MRIQDHPQPPPVKGPAAASFDRATVRALMDLMAIEGCNFYYNEPNDYGTITCKLFTGEGDAGRFMGEEEQGRFRGGIRGTGYYKLNEAGIDRIMELLGSKVCASKGLS